MRVAFVEWPEGLSPSGSSWGEIALSVAAARPDLLVTNELPFGPWIAEGVSFSEAEAEESLRAHAEGLEALAGLGLPAVVSSRPVRAGSRLGNEAFVLENGAARALHRKQYFPSEPGWFESAWYSGDGSGFVAAAVLGIRVGVLLCTDAMFNEHARAYGRQEASLIVLPRATGSSVEPWKTAGAMGALVSGAYVVSSNRVGLARGGTVFGGVGFAYAPGGRWVADTSPAGPVRTIELDPEVSASARRDYPCYVPDRA
jgi:N-carbamoylputrescine amidase